MSQSEPLSPEERLLRGEDPLTVVRDLAARVSSLVSRVREAERVLAEAREAWADGEATGLDDFHNARGRLRALLGRSRQ